MSSRNKRLQKPTLCCLFEPLIRKRFNLLKLIYQSIYQLRSVEVYKDLSIIKIGNAFGGKSGATVRHYFC